MAITTAITQTCKKELLDGVSIVLSAALSEPTGSGTAVCQAQPLALSVSEPSAAGAARCTADAASLLFDLGSVAATGAIGDGTVVYLAPCALTASTGSVSASGAQLDTGVVEISPLALSLAIGSARASGIVRDTGAFTGVRRGEIVSFNLRLGLNSVLFAAHPSATAIGDFNGRGTRRVS
jgi:hypothetical protein